VAEKAEIVTPEASTLESPATVEDRPGWKPSRLSRVARELLALSFWFYLAVKPFVFDIDRWVIDKISPELAWLVDWRFAFFASGVGLAVLLMKPKKLAWWALWVVFYPAVLAFWRLPKLLFQLKSWTLGLAVIGTAIAMLRSVRFTLPVLAGILTGLIMALYATRNGALVAAIVLLIAGTLLVYGRLVVRAFVPGESPFSKEALDSVGKAFRSIIAAMPLAAEGISSEDPNDEKRQSQLEFNVLYSRACHFLASKFSDLRRSSLNVAAALLQVAGMALLSAVTLGMAAYALYRLDVANYAVDGAASAFTFVYLGFKSLLGGSVPGIVPVSTAAQSLDMLTAITGWLVLLVILVNAVLIIRAKREGERLSELASALADHGKSVEIYIDGQFGVSIDDAIEELTRAKSALIKWVYYLTPSIQDDSPDWRS
jgi:hypothetical protein